jgi:SAM-dependent methyltransferase
MPSAYYVGRVLWRKLIPRSLDRVAFGGNNDASRLILAIKGRMERLASHDELYDAEYFRRCDADMATSGPAIAASLMARYSPTSVLDVGCGPGSILAGFRDLGVRVAGLEYSEPALAMSRAKGLDVRKFDLESEGPGLEVTEPAHLVVSTEVAEHLPAECADRYVALLCRHARRWIVVTAATPGQGGTDHVNEQPFDYWIAKFQAAGATYDAEATTALRADWTARDIDRSRARNVLAFGAPEANPS